MSVTALQALPFDEILGWYEYFAARPPGWREDNRAAIQVMSVAGSKIRPEDLFSSLKQMKLEAARMTAEQDTRTVGEKFFSLFADRMTNQRAVVEFENNA